MRERERERERDGRARRVEAINMDSLAGVKRRQ
jgi:hypothetical protein